MAPEPGAIFESMVDPSLVAPAVRASVAAAKWWHKRPEVSLLVALLDQRFGTETGLSHSTWAALIADERFVELLSPALADGAVFDRAGFIGAIEPHVGALSADGSPGATAAAVADAIRELLPRAKETDREATLHGLERVEGAIWGSSTPQLTWAPPFLGGVQSPV